MKEAESMAGAGDRKSVMLVDGFGLIFRAYHALPPSMTTTAGEQVNAVYGFASMLLDTINSRKPDYAIVALDKGTTFRHEAYEEYKANRAETPPDLEHQVARVIEFVHTLGVPALTRDGYEADDIIGSLSHRLVREGHDVIIVTGDSDLLQLVEDGAIAVLPGTKRFGDFREYDPAAVVERFGFESELIPDYKALVGDTSDNIPGVPGIGDKTAKKLIAEFGDLEEIIAHNDEVSPTRARNALAENHEQARKSKELATIVRDLDFDLDLDDATVGRFDLTEMTKLFRELEFRSLLNRLPESTLGDGETTAPEEAINANSERTTVTTDEELDALVMALAGAEAVAIDVETDSTDPITATLVGTSLAVSPTRAWYVPVGHREGDQLPLDRVRKALDPALNREGLKVVAHHGKYDLHVLRRHGFTLDRLDFDTMIAAFLIGDTSIRLKDLAFTRVGVQMTEITELIGTGRNQDTMDNVAIELAAPYACADVECTLALMEPLKADLEARALMPLFTEIELPLVPVLIGMETRGVAIDTGELEAFSKEITKRLEEVEAEIDTLAGRPVKVGSNKQMATVLFEELGLPAGRKTKTGYSVDSNVLEGIRTQHPIVDLILEFRALAKLKSTYVEALPQAVNPADGRVHTSYNQTVAATGRLSSVNPNLQNIPIRTELGRRVRRAFVADRRPEHRIVDNAILLGADYSQMELRILAHMSGEPFLVNAFREGDDIHRATAALVNQVEFDAVTSDQRRVAKTVNFGILYGMQAFGLSRDTGMARDEAQKFIDAYWERLPRVRQFFDELIEFGREHGYVQTLSGRRRYIPDLNSRNGMQRQAAQRMAMNMPIQGTQADIIKRAMIELDAALTERHLPGYQVLQVHDELVLEVDETRLDEIATLLRDTMRDAERLDVPVIVDLRTGMNWEDMQPYEPKGE
jgi:DNA polymerase-1